MAVETLSSDMHVGITVIDESLLHHEPLNGTDARRRLEDKIEDLRLKRELKEFDFDD